MLWGRDVAEGGEGRERGKAIANPVTHGLFVLMRVQHP